MKKLNVYLKSSPDKKKFVGRLAAHERRVYFQYDPQFLSDSLWLSPYKLPLQPDVFEHKDRDFAPIFGLFDDSLPDGWGLLLMDRYLRGRGIDSDTLSVLDRLSFLGDATIGALVVECC